MDIPMAGENNAAPVGVFVIILFLLIGLIVMGCMLYMNWIHHKQRSIIEANNFISSGNACIYEKTNTRPTYNRSTSLIITAPTQPYSCLDAENGAVAQKI